jgi:NAD(P)-dependent dehydrogenase (short-subunit alcohol dehydrogenase family)
MQTIAESWAIAGASGIVITGRKADILESIATRIQSLAPSGTKVLAHAADITSEASVAALFAAAKEAVGKIDVLVNSAGSLEQGPLGGVDPTKFFNDFQVNVLGAYLVTHHFLAQADGVGTVVSLTTGGIAQPFPGMGGYTASKLAFVRIMENLHAEQPGIRVFMLMPGIVRTQMTIDALKPYSKDSPELSGSWTLFLSTPRAEWMRGGIVSVNCESSFLCEKRATFLTWAGILRGYRGDGGTQGSNCWRKSPRSGVSERQTREGWAPLDVRRRPSDKKR